MPKNVTVRVVGDISDVQKKLGEVESRVGKFGDGIKSKLKSLSPAALVGGVAAAGAGVVAFAGTSVKAFEEAEQSQAKLQSAYRKFPALAGGNISALQKLDTELAKKTKYDDDATAAAQAQLAQFGLTQKQLVQLTPLVQDYAARTGKDLTTAAQDVGKALQGKGRALMSVGLNLKDTKDATKNYTQVVDGLSDKVGGFAEKQGKTMSGRMEIMRNQFGELQERVGGALVPVLLKLATVATTVVTWFTNLNGTGKAVIGVIGGLVLAVLAINKAIQAWTAVQAALNAVMALNPFVLIGIALAALVAGLVIAYEKSDTFRAIVDGAFHGVVAAAVFMKDKVLGAIRFLVDTWLAEAEWIVKAGAKAFGWVPGVGGKLKAAAKAVEQFRDDVNEKLGGIKDKTIKVDLQGGFSQITNPDKAGSTVSRRLPGRAAGGSVIAGEMYMVGERGPEPFIPRTSGTILPTSVLGQKVVTNNNTINMEVNGSDLDPRQVANLVSRNIVWALQGVGR